MAETGRKKRLPELGRRGFLSKRDAKEGSPCKQSPGGSPKRPTSPEPNCSICLGGIEDQSFANKCFHSFCKTCLFEWSKVKPECPVCRQGFDSIIFNVKAMDDYEEYNIPRPLSPRSLWSVGAYITESGRWETREISSFNILRHRVIHLQDMFERTRANRELAPRAPDRLSFLYAIDPTTASRDNNSNSNLPFATTNSNNSNNNNNTSERTPPRAHRSSRTPGFHFDLATYIRNLDTVRPPTAGTFDHRRYIYEHDLWVQPITGRLARECSATFYRTNPAVTHRLLPFLNRELVAILRTDSESNHSAEALLSRIKAAIFEYDIPSIRFRQVIEPYTRDKTHHFLHELYYFAKSPYTIEDYNVHAIYVPKSHVKQLKLEQQPVLNRPFAVFTNNQEPETDSSTDDSVIELVDFEQEHNSRRDINRMQYIASSSLSSVSATRTNTTTTLTPSTTINPSVTQATSETAKSGYDEKETRKAIKQVQKLTKEMSSHANQETPLTLTLPTLSQNINVIEDFDNPRPGPSGLCRKNDFKASNQKLKVDDDGSDTEIDVGTNEKPMLKLDYDSDSGDSDASIKVVGYKKPIRERTPEIINISSCGESAGDGRKKSDDEEDDSEDDEGPEKKRIKMIKEVPLKLTKGSSGHRFKIEMNNKGRSHHDDDKITDSEGSENEKEKSSKKKQKKRRKTKSSHSKRRKDSSSTRQIDIDGNTTQTDSTSSEDETSIKKGNQDKMESWKFFRRIPSVIVRPRSLKTSSTSNLLCSLSSANNPATHNILSSSTTATATATNMPNTNSINTNVGTNSDISNTTTTTNTNNNVIATLCSSLKRKFDESSSDTESTDNDTCERFNDILRAFI